MATIGSSYNPDVVPAHGCTPLPAGEYTLEIVESSYDANNDGDGMVLALKTQILGGDFDQRPYLIWIDLENEDPTKQERGQRDFAGLRRAVDVLNPQDTEELHWIPFRVGITAQISKRTGGPVNWIVQYLWDDEPAARDPREKSTEWRNTA